MAPVNKEIAELDKEKRELLEYLLSEEGINLSKTLIVPGRRESNIAPLSFSQERLWVLRQIEPDNPFYTKAAAVRLKGQLRFGALIPTLRSIVQRHEVLRTVFPSVNGKPQQVIQPLTSLNLAFVDLSSLLEQEREAELDNLIAEESQRPFDLEREHLLRLMLLRMGESDHVLFFILHHMISDAWSGNILIRELEALYNAYSKGQPSPLADLPVQYADFAIWQRERIQGQFLESELAYWKEQLAGELPVLKLPTDRPRPAIQTANCADFRQSLSKPLTDALYALSKREGVTLFMTLLAAFKTLLYRYTGDKDVIVAVPITNRSQAELEGLIGMFVNTLALRTVFTEHTPFRELLGRVRQVALSAYAHQEVPFEKVVEELNPARSLSHTPLCQVWLVFRDAPLPTLRTSELSLTPIEIHNKSSQIELILDLCPSPSGLEGCFEYNADLFDQATIERMIGHYQTLLEDLSANPDKRLSELELLSAAERCQLLDDFNAQAASYAEPGLIAEWFSRRAEESAEAVALQHEEQQVSYEELNRRVNRLGRYLQRIGVGPEMRVGVCLGRGIDLVVALLAVLKAGGAYVPLDPTYPQERLQFMLTDSDASVLLTHQGLADFAPAGLQVVYLDRAPELLAQESDANIDRAIEPENLAYLIYTSGSTGKPKGAMITHGGLKNYLAWAINAYQITGETDALVHTSISFDLTVTALYAPLLAGGKVRLLADKASVEDLAEALDQGWRYELLKITPAHMTALNGLLAESEPQPRCRLLLVGGEALHSENVNAWRTHAKDCQIINEYGPTETVVGSTLFEVADDCESEGDVPIGRPVANTQVYILDPQLQPAPVNISGEIYIGGNGLARGYFNRPELTAERFIPSPHSKAPGSRVYKTGDQGKFLPHDGIAFLGRRDHMLKIRGYRIELGEIEATLCQHPAIHEAVVVVRSQTGQDQRLVAYWVGKAGATSAEDLKEYLKAKLPDYMVPATYVALDALPISPSGKVDRQALPALEAEHSDLPLDDVAHASPQEQALAEIWADVLGVERVGRHDNFFKLGGDSILSILVLSRARRAGMHFTPKQMFQYQTIAELSLLTASDKVADAEQGAVTGAVVMTPIQKWFLEQDVAEPHHFNQSLLLESRRRLDAGRMRQISDHLLKHHDALRLRFKREGFGWSQYVAAPDDEPPFTEIDLSALEPQRQRAALEASAAAVQASLNLSAGPLIRLALYRLQAGQPAHLLITAHHLTIDGVSWRILLEDMQSAYEQLEQGIPVQFGDKTTSYQQWAKQLAEYAMRPELRREADYWSGPQRRAIKPLPLDWQAAENSEADADAVTVSLDEDQTRALLQDLNEAFNTPITDVLLAALVAAFSGWTRESHLLVDMERHGREDLFAGVDLSRTVGWFTVIYPVLLEHRSGPPNALLCGVRDQLQMVPNGGMGYGLLRYMSEDGELVAKLADLPHAEVSFNYLGQTDQMFSEAGGLTVATARRGADRSPKAKRRYLIEVTGVIAEGKLQVIWKYSRRLHDRRTIEHLAEGYIRALAQLIQSGQSPGIKAMSATDFSLANLKQSELDRLLEDVEFEV